MKWHFYRDPTTPGPWAPGIVLPLLGHGRHLDGHTASPYTGGIHQFMSDFFSLLVTYLPLQHPEECVDVCY